MTINRLAIVGCGLTGAVTAMLIKQRLPDLNVVILEKSKGTGGRMCTSRSALGSYLDLGAQFITKTTHLSDIQERCYSELLKEGLLEPLCETILGIKSTSSTVGHFVCPSGSGSLVRYFLHKSGCETLFNHKVVKINVSNGKWIIQCDNKTRHEFEAVILTLPIPQILGLEGIQKHLQEGQHEKLQAVQYSSRFALGLFYNKEDSDYFSSIPYSAKFISDNPVIRYCSIDNRKRNATGLPCVVIHTTKEFGEAHIDKDSTIVQNLIFNEVEKLFPHMPKASEIKFHKWRYSQVVNSFKEHDCLLLMRTPILICGGDGFTYSTLEGCILSAENITQLIVNST